MCVITMHGKKAMRMGYPPSSTTSVSKPSPTQSRVVKPYNKPNKSGSLNLYLYKC